MQPFPGQSRKRYTQLLRQSRSTPLYLADADGWALMWREPRPTLCPYPGCGVELISYENPNNRYTGDLEDQGRPAGPAITSVTAARAAARKRLSTSG
jgi:hypothetical protein